MGVVLAGSACSDRAVADTKRDAGAALDTTRTAADKTLDATKKAGDEAADFTKDLAQKTADETRAVASEVSEKSGAIATATGAEVTDSWIRTKVKAKFADEIVLKGSDIRVETTDHVVTLRGTVPSGVAKARAAEIARGTERVTRVVTELAVK